MDKFFKGFEKKANIVRQGLRTLGNITGARHLKAGFKDISRLQDTGRLVGTKPSNLKVSRKHKQRALTAGKNLTTGTKRMVGTGAAVGATAYGVNKLNKKASFAAKMMGTLGKGTKPLTAKGSSGLKLPQVPKPSQAIRGVSSMKI